jgi:hypothetical protein
MKTGFVRVALGAVTLALMAPAVLAAPQKGHRADRPGKAEAKKEMPPASPATSAGITYALKDLIKAKSGEFCAPYGGDGSCIQEVEICLAMVDRDGDPVRLCVNSTPGEKSEAQPRTARYRP